MTGFCDFGPLMDFTVSRVLWVNKTLNFERFKFYKTITTFSVGVFKASQEISSKYILGKWKLGPVIAEIRFLDFYLSKSVLKFFYSLERITLKLQRQKFILSLLTRESGGGGPGENVFGYGWKPLSVVHRVTFTSIVQSSMQTCGQDGYVQEWHKTACSLTTW